MADQKEEEEKREKELDDMVSAEVEKQWKQRLAQWRKEKEARRKLVNDVMETRKKQIQEKSLLKNIKRLLLLLFLNFTLYYHLDS